MSQQQSLQERWSRATEALEAIDELTRKLGVLVQDKDLTGDPISQTVKTKLEQQINTLKARALNLLGQV